MQEEDEVDEDDPIKLFHYEADRVHFGSQPLEADRDDPETSTNLDIDLSDIDLDASVKLVDCGKYPWYYKKYSDQIKSKINDYHLITDSESDEDVVVEDLSDEPVNDTTIKQFSQILSSNNILNELSQVQQKTTLEKRQETMTRPEDIELQKVLSPKNIYDVDFKRNTWLIGMKVYPKFIKTTLEERQETMRRREDIRELQRALSLKNLNNVDFKRNTGLIGMKVTPKFVKNLETDTSTLQANVTLSEDEKTNKPKVRVPIQINLDEVPKRLLHGIKNKKAQPTPDFNKLSEITITKVKVKPNKNLDTLQSLKSTSGNSNVKSSSSKHVQNIKRTRKFLNDQIKAVKYLIIEKSTTNTEKLPTKKIVSKIEEKPDNKCLSEEPDIKKPPENKPAEVNETDTNQSVPAEEKPVLNQTPSSEDVKKVSLTSKPPSISVSSHEKNIPPIQIVSVKNIFSSMDTYPPSSNIVISSAQNMTPAKCSDKPEITKPVPKVPDTNIIRNISTIHRKDDDVPFKNRYASAIILRPNNFSNRGPPPPLLNPPLQPWPKYQPRFFKSPYYTGQRMPPQGGEDNTFLHRSPGCPFPNYKFRPLQDINQHQPYFPRFRPMNNNWKPFPGRASPSPLSSKINHCRFRTYHNTNLQQINIHQMHNVFNTDAVICVNSALGKMKDVADNIMNSNISQESIPKTDTNKNSIARLLANKFNIGEARDDLKKDTNITNNANIVNNKTKIVEDGNNLKGDINKNNNAGSTMNKTNFEEVKNHFKSNTKSNVDTVVSTTNIEATRNDFKRNINKNSSEKSVKNKTNNVALSDLKGDINKNSNTSSTMNKTNFKEAKNNLKSHFNKSTNSVGTIVSTTNIGATRHDFKRDINKICSAESVKNKTKNEAISDLKGNINNNAGSTMNMTNFEEAKNDLKSNLNKTSNVDTVVSTTNIGAIRHDFKRNINKNDSEESVKNKTKIGATSNLKGDINKNSNAVLTMNKTNLEEATNYLKTNINKTSNIDTVVSTTYIGATRHDFKRAVNKNSSAESVKNRTKNEALSNIKRDINKNSTTTGSVTTKNKIREATNDLKKDINKDSNTSSTINKTKTGEAGNNLKRGVEETSPKEHFDKRQKIKIEPEDQLLNQINHQNGYSPPILPIPTYEKVMGEVISTFQKQDELLGRMFEKNGNTDIKNRKDDTRKISLEEYKRRTLTGEKCENPQGNGFGNQYCIDRNSYSQIEDSIKTETDPGYDSDRTVIL